eukprot:765976-Hanusia_phi.AAC.6
MSKSRIQDVIKTLLVDDNSEQDPIARAQALLQSRSLLLSEPDVREDTDDSLLQGSISTIYAPAHMPTSLVRAATALARKTMLAKALHAWLRQAWANLREAAKSSTTMAALGSWRKTTLRKVKDGNLWAGPCLRPTMTLAQFLHVRKDTVRGGGRGGRGQEEGLRSAGGGEACVVVPCSPPILPATNVSAVEGANLQLQVSGPSEMCSLLT